MGQFEYMVEEIAGSGEIYSFATPALARKFVKKLESGTWTIVCWDNKNDCLNENFAEEIYHV